MGIIFLSYARDDEVFARTLARALESAGHEVWWDRRIDSGEEFAAEIEAALERADVVLVAWSAHSVKSAWVRDEASAGRDDGRLLPVSIDGWRPPMGFRQYQTLELPGWKGGSRDARTAELLKAVDRRLSDFPAVTDELAYANLRDDPRMKRIDAIIAADIDRERRELLAAGV